MNRQVQSYQRLRALEEAIIRERKFIAELKSHGLEYDGEKERLAELLGQLDQVLRSGNALSGASI